jgi:flagellar hook-associated protein 2
MERRLEAVEKRLRAQFTALDAMVASMLKTSSFLERQLATLSSSS